MFIQPMYILVFINRSRLDVFGEVDKMTLISCYFGSKSFLLVFMQYFKAQCNIDSQFSTVVDNVDRREMIWSYECWPWCGRFEISRGPPPSPPSYTLTYLIRAQSNKNREMFSINLILKMTVVLYHWMEDR